MNYYNFEQIINQTNLGCSNRIELYADDGGGFLVGGNKPSNCIVENVEKGEVKSSL